MADSKSSGSGDVMVQPQQGEIHPRGLLSAIGYIERSYASERGGCLIDSDFLTTPQRTEFLEVGFRSSFASGFAMAILFPLTIGVLDRHIPIFGEANPSAFDLACGIFLALSFPLGYSCFLASAASKHLGGYSRAMISNLLGGVALASMVKAVLLFLGFHIVYFKVINGPNVTWVLNKLQEFSLSYDRALEIYTWVMDFRPVFVKSAYYVFGSTIVFVAIPYISMWMAHIRNQKMIKAGVVDVFSNYK